jgi:hypothetical protein
MIGITEPRRVAAVSMAKRVAYEMNLPGPDDEVSSFTNTSLFSLSFLSL